MLSLDSFIELSNHLAQFGKKENSESESIEK